MTLDAYRKFIIDRHKGDEFKKAVDRKYLNVMLGEYLELLYLHPDTTEDLNDRIRDYAVLAEREPYCSAIKEIPAEGMGFFQGNEFRFLRNKSYKSLFFLKKTELAIRNIIIHKFG